MTDLHAQNIALRAVLESTISALMSNGTLSPNFVDQLGSYKRKPNDGLDAVIAALEDIRSSLRGKPRKGAVTFTVIDGGKE